MKKVLVSALALGLVVGVAATAAAYDKFEVSGYYKLDGVYGESLSTAGATDITTQTTADNDGAWWEHSMRVYPKLTVNDKITLNAEIRFLDNHVWGNSDIQRATYSGGRTIDFNKIWMDYESPIGKIRVGRPSAGAWHDAFVNSIGRENRIMWWPNFIPKPFTALVFTEKTDEFDAIEATGLNDQDTDYYEVDFGYKVDGFVVDFGLGYQNKAATPDADMMRFKGYGKYTMDNLYFESEFDHKFGSMTTTVDYDQWAFMARVGGTFGALSAKAEYFYISGDETGVNDDEGYKNIGADYTHGLILVGGDYGLVNPNTSVLATPDIGDDGVHGFAVNTSFKVSDKLGLTGVFVMANADEEASGVDDEYGWEIGAGMSYKLLDNLTYSLNFGYAQIGDYFDAGVAGTMKEDSAIAARQKLNMTF